MFKAVLFAAILAVAAASPAAVNASCAVEPGGAMKTTSCTMDSATHSFPPGTNATLTLVGTVNKVITAGTFSYKIFEDAVQHFVASGNVAYFTCNNKGCDPSKPIALKLDPMNSAPANFTGQINFTIPQPQKTGKYHIAFWGQDQDHNPYDVTGTVSLAGTCSSDADCPPGSYCQDGPGHVPPYACHAA